MCLKIVSITGDSGGGGKVQGIFDRLVELGVIDDKWGRFIRCLLHVLNKCIENATKLTFGDQGLGKTCAAQLLYNALTLFVKVRSIGGLELLDEQFTKIAEKLNTDDEWRTEAMNNSPMAFADREQKVAAELASALDEIDHEDFEGVNPFGDEAEEELQGAYFADESEEAVVEDENEGATKVSNYYIIWLQFFELTFILAWKSIEGRQGQAQCSSEQLSALEHSCTSCKVCHW